MRSHPQNRRLSLIPKILGVLVLCGVLSYLVFNLLITNSLEPDPTSSVKILTLDPVLKELRKIEPIKSSTDILIDIPDVYKSVSFSKVDLNFFTLPDGINVQMLYEKLSAKALNGDVVAARLLAQELAKCNSTTLAKKSDDITKLRQMHSDGNYVERYESGYSYSLDNGEIKNLSLNPLYIPRMEKSLATQRLHCQGVTESQQNESRDWAKLAAEKGDFLATRFLIEDNTASEKERYSWANKLWNETGAVEALHAMWGLHYYGNSQGRKGSDEFQPSKIKAYAYYLAAAELELVLISREDQFNFPNKRMELDSSKVLISAELSAAEHLEAEELATSMVSSNPNCCSIPK